MPANLGNLAHGFERWHGVFARGLSIMRSQGRLRDEADTEELADVLLAAFQGGALLAQVSGDARPLRASLTSAIAYVESFARGPIEPTDGGNREPQRS